MKYKPVFKQCIQTDFEFVEYIPGFNLTRHPIKHCSRFCFLLIEYDDETQFCYLSIYISTVSANIHQYWNRFETARTDSHHPRYAINTQAKSRCLSSVHCQSSSQDSVSFQHFCGQRLVIGYLSLVCQTKSKHIWSSYKTLHN